MKDLKLLQDTNRYTAALTLPDFPRRADGTLDRDLMRAQLLAEEYGTVDDTGITVEDSVEKTENKLFAGKCELTTVALTLRRGDDARTFHIRLFVPYAAPYDRTVVLLNFEDVIPNKYFPVEELMDRRLTVAYLYYKEITTDDGDFTTGIAPLLSDRTRGDGAGKLALWAYAARLAADYLLREHPECRARLAVAGHSRLGKTALLAGALDERFTLVHANCSGCCGAAIAREKTGETVARIVKRFPYWFCPRFAAYAGREEEMPFDQHTLLALIAPRKLAIVAADEDTWADTDAQYLAAEAASVAYAEAGVAGLDESDGILPMPGESTRGRIVFSKRLGTHFFSRADWAFFDRVFN